MIIREDWTTVHQRLDDLDKMDKFLERCKLLKLTQENKMKTWIDLKQEITLPIKNFPQEKNKMTSLVNSNI